MQMRRGLAIVGIVVILAVFAAVGITAVLVAGREISKVDPSRSPTPTPTSTATP
jgi:flagellar basal body-associated protein FliL